MRQNRLQLLTAMLQVSMFTALTAVGALIRIPLPPVPVTLQLLFALCAGLMLGPWLGALSQLLYIALGLAGLPVFAQGGGIQYVFNPSFGYLVGFAAAAFVTGAVARRPAADSLPRLVLAAAAGVAVIYLFGVGVLYAQLRFVAHQPASFSGVLVSGCLVFLPWDAVKVALAVPVSRQVCRRVRLAGVR